MTNETTTPPRTILIVDDDPLFREYLRELLGQQGYAIVEAADGREGLKLYERHRPALVMLDILMPERDGIDCLHEIRKQNQEAIIFTMTAGEWGPQNSRSAQLLGAKRTFLKPIDPARLLAAIREDLDPPR